jgi:Domain of unknown function (DUF4145)
MVDQTLVQAPCSECHRETWHDVLHEVRRADEDGDVFGYRMIECAGCKTVSLEYSEYLHGPAEKADYRRYYPSPATRKPPPWSFELSWDWIGGVEGDNLGELLQEIYEAVRGGQHRLAMMGVRAMLEQIIIIRVGDQGTFAKNLERFHDAGFISTVQRDSLDKLLEAGHATMHRLFKPREADLTIALDMIEGVFAAIFVHPYSAEQLAKRVPDRELSPIFGDGLIDQAVTKNRR